MWVIAEVSANHNGDSGGPSSSSGLRAEAGADAVKFQTYTADSMTLDLDTGPFRIGAGTIWEGRGLHELYHEAATPYEWHDDLFAEAEALWRRAVLDTVRRRAVDFLETFTHRAQGGVVRAGRPGPDPTRRRDRPGRDHVHRHGHRGRDRRRRDDGPTAGAGGVVLLPLQQRVSGPVRRRWTSRRSPTWPSAGASPSVSRTTRSAPRPPSPPCWACVLEKHLTLARADGGPDAAFSLEPDELAELVTAVHEAEAALGTSATGSAAAQETGSLAFRRSLFVVADVDEGDLLTDQRTCERSGPVDGLAPKHLERVLGRTATTLERSRGTPVDWSLVED